VIKPLDWAWSSETWKSFPLQLGEGIQHSVVFRIHADQMTATVGSRMAKQGQIVGFGGAAR
jgi:hypothetical protein